MIKKYKKDDFTVVWDPKRCTHSTRCFHGLPEVFNPSKRPWIDTNGAEGSSILAQVAKCPSGALSIKRD